MNENEELPDAVQQIKNSIETRIEAETIGIEFLKQLHPIVESRHKLQESEVAFMKTLKDFLDCLQNVQTSMVALTEQFNSLAMLKKENLELERETLQKIKAVLK